MLAKSRVKYIQTLGQKKFRQEERCFIAEGPKLVSELIQERPADIIEIFALPEWIEEHRKIAAQVPCTEISVQELEKISQLSSPHSVLALLRQFVIPEQPETGKEWVLALDNIRDPGNMGTLLRIADWFGIRSLVCSEDCVDIYNPKVVQSSMGSIARVDVFVKDLAGWLVSVKDTRIFAAVLGGQDIHRVTNPGPGILLIGNESTGIREELVSLSHLQITIPRKGKAESLNAAVAAGIILSYLT